LGDTEQFRLRVNIFKKLNGGIHVGLRYLSLAVDEPGAAFSLFYLTVTNRALAAELFSYKPYQKWIANAGIKTIIDVGAHVGRFAFAFKHILPAAQVYSFEPQPDCYQALVKNLSPYDRFEAFQVALGDKHGEVPFFKCVYSESSSVLPMSNIHKDAFPWTAEHTTIAVPMQMLDDWMGQIDIQPKVLLKIDTQGYEDKVLRGGLKMLKKVDYVILEVSYKAVYDGQPLFDDIYAFMRAQGFELAGTLGDTISPRDGSFLQSDMLFARAG
jgi:FkbM family methyltransferase